MAETLATTATEGGTYVVTLAFTDESGAEATPKTGVWTLTDSNGDVVNGRENVVVSSLASTIYIVLSGADLPSNGHKLEELLLTFQGTYDSDLGFDLPIIDQCIIAVEEASQALLGGD